MGFGYSIYKKILYGIQLFQSKYRILGVIDFISNFYLSNKIGNYGKKNKGKITNYENIAIVGWVFAAAAFLTGVCFTIYIFWWVKRDKSKHKKHRKKKLQPSWNLD